MVAITATTMATITTTTVMAAITVGGTPTADGFSWQSSLSVLSCYSFCFREFWQYTIYISIVADMLFSCITARRRRRMGRPPYPMTGWAGRNGPGYNPQNQQGYYNQPNGGYNPNNPGYNVPPPAYGQQYGGASAPQQPGPIYQGARGGENVYDNTPGKKDNVVR